MTRATSNFFYMLTALLIFLVVLPIADDLELLSQQATRTIGYTCLFVVGVWSLQGSGKWFRVGLSLVGAGMLLNVLAYSYNGLGYLYGSIATLIVFLAVAIVHALKQVVLGIEVSANRLVGAVCVYLLLGTLWALAYTVIELAMPGSFKGIDVATDAHWGSNWVYFSFVTLTTLGYGDITPITGTARALVYTEAVFGIFYMAMLVAGLVGVYMAERQKSG